MYGNVLNDVKNMFFSGAEDKHGYIWDRHYGICLTRLPHTDVVNSVAFNPKDPEMLVSVSDDQSIKVCKIIILFLTQYKYIQYLNVFFY